MADVHRDGRLGLSTQVILHRERPLILEIGSVPIGPMIAKTGTTGCPVIGQRCDREPWLGTND
jgi:hypothetical protein